MHAQLWAIAKEMVKNAAALPAGAGLRDMQQFLQQQVAALQRAEQGVANPPVRQKRTTDTVNKRKRAAADRKRGTSAN
jgi:hypothetical protein